MSKMLVKKINKGLLFVTILLFILVGIIILHKSIFSLLFPSKTLHVSITGSDKNNGSKKNPIRTINHALEIAEPGTTIIILPGIYRETVNITKSGKLFSPITLTVSPNDKNNVILVGSEPASSLSWSSCSSKTCQALPLKTTSHVYYTELDWTEVPNLIVEKTADGTEYLLPIAREPNLQVSNISKYHENWWRATDSQNNQYVLRDKDNLTRLNNLEGTTVFAMDGADRCGTFLYTAKIDKHNKNQGEIYFSNPLGLNIYGLQENGIGPFTKYFLEGNLQLLNQPGEWFFDPTNKKLYLWPIGNDNPASLNIEIAKRPTVLEITASNIQIIGLKLKYINENNFSSSKHSVAIYIQPSQKSNIKNINIKNVEITYSNKGIQITAPDSSSQVNNIKIDGVDISYCANNAVNLAGSSDEKENVKNIYIENSHIHHSGFRYNAVGLNFTRIHDLKLRNNYIHDLPSNGIKIVSYEKKSILSKNILIETNNIENICQNTSWCAALKFFGGKFTNTIARRNILRNNIGWSYCQEKKNKTIGPAIGLFISNASGIEVYDNIAINNSGFSYYVFPRQIEVNNNKLLNNLAGYSNIGVFLDNPVNAKDYNKIAFQTRHDNTVIKNNVFLENNIGINIDPANPNRIQIDNNAYIDNQINMVYQDKEMKKLSDIQKNIPYWDEHSIETDKKTFKNADNNDFNISYFSKLRGKGESIFSKTLIIGKILKLLGFGNDIGPCKFKWIGNSCPTSL